MARMHSRKRGKSGSKKPIQKTTPSWVRYKPKEIELLITKMAKEGLRPSRIGLKLRDAYGIPNTKSIIGLSISKFLQKKKLANEIPEDLFALMRRAVLITKHLEENHKDKTAQRGMTLVTSKINRLVKYYKKQKRLPQDWTYDLNKLKLLVD